MIRTIRAETAMAAVMVAVAVLRPACADAEDIAMSLVNPKGRIDVPVGDIRGVEAWATTSSGLQGTEEVHEYPESARHSAASPTTFLSASANLRGGSSANRLSIVIDCESFQSRS